MELNCAKNMHFKNDIGVNSNAKDSTAASCTSTTSTSSSDSGVIIIDNQTTFSSSANNSNNNKNCDNLITTQTDKSNEKSTTDDGNLIASPTQNNNNKSQNTADSRINIENFINIERTADLQRPHNVTPATATAFPSPKGYSPTVSIRSTTISIVSIDENAIDSSVIDSDSDVEADAEGVHSNYIVKKLGQQTTYPPNSTDIPQLKNGLTVIGQTISPGATAPNGGIENALAKNMLNGGNSPMALATAVTPTTPQIGSIALTNSTDVTFGDKHFYEGPVTIQQFLIDNGRDKSGQDNPAFRPDPNAKESDNDGTGNGEDASAQPFKFMFHRKALIITGAIVLLTILIGVAIVIVTNLSKAAIPKSKLLGDGDDSRKNIPINSKIADTDNDAESCDEKTLCVMRRSDWQGRPAKANLTQLNLPVHRIIISHTVSDYCYNKEVCSFRVQVVQNFHMDSWGWDDIGYNFLVGGDGRVYVGRGWNSQGAHTKGYNTDSYGISFIGTFTIMEPTKIQLNAAKRLIEEGVLQHKIAPNYRLYGARQLGSTESPGEALFNIIKTWSRFSENIRQDNIGGGNILRIVARDAWLAQPPSNALVKLDLPVPRVIVLPTNTDTCDTQASCTFRVRLTQTYNIESQQNDDIIYNFLIGGDGNVYEGRGWDSEGAHLKGFNDDSVSFAYIGTFKAHKPTAKQINVTRLLLDEGVTLGKLSKDYKIFGANTLEPSSTATSAKALYDSFKDWPHWSEKV